MGSRFDVLVVGAGLFGATCAHELTRRGLSCLVLEQRPHIGGNCYSEQRDGIHVHMYGPHIFHTSDQRIWDWVRQFSDFNQYQHRIKVSYKGRFYSFPLNLITFQELWGVQTAEEARTQLESVRIPQQDLGSVEGWALSQFGRELYEIFIRGYTKKQWGKPPPELPAAILKRIPVRFTADDGYFNDHYQGIPSDGYTAMFVKLLRSATLRLSTDYFDDRRYFDGLAKRVIYTGPIDRFFEYRFGPLEYRSVRLQHDRLSVPDFQQIAVVNYAEEDVPYTRIVEHKHFDGRHNRRNVTWITREYPEFAGGELEPMYPLRDAANTQVFERYAALAAAANPRGYHFGGRLAEYQYYDMHQVIASALKMAERVAAGLGASRCVAI